MAIPPKSAKKKPVTTHSPDTFMAEAHKKLHYFLTRCKSGTNRRADISCSYLQVNLSHPYPDAPFPKKYDSIYLNMYLVLYIEIAYRIYLLETMLSEAKNGLFLPYFTIIFGERI
jgi:hypothetical protein